MNCFLRHLKYRTVLLAIAVLAVVGMCAEGSVKRIEVMLPEDNAWLKAAPMISFDGSYENSAEMKPVPDLCSWYYYEWGPDEKVPESVVFFRPDDVEMNDVIGDGYSPFPISSFFSFFADTLYYPLDENYQDNDLVETRRPVYGRYCVGDTVVLPKNPADYHCNYLGGCYSVEDSCHLTRCLFISLLDSNGEFVLEEVKIPEKDTVYFCGIYVPENLDFSYNSDSICLDPGKYTLRFRMINSYENFNLTVPSKTDYLNRESRIISPVSIIPKNGSIQISSKSAKQPYSIMDSQGRVLRRGMFNQRVEIPVPSSGSYIVKVGNVVRNLRVNN